MNSNFSQFPEGGNRRIRKLLESIQEDESKLDKHPLYQEGFDDGRRAAEEQYKKLTSALSQLYQIQTE